MSEKLHFITSSGIKNIVGKDLITDRFVAIFELVKNAYDAKASKVVVSFNIDNSSETKSLQSIVIRDNGIGMNRDDLEKKWLHLAYSEKKEGQSNSGRAFVGSKGIGRFSCDSLGSNLTITTKKTNDPIEHILKVDWKDFEKSLEDRFESIAVDYNYRKVEDEKLGTSYTVLKITNLHHLWDDDAIIKVSDSLQRLKNPFNEDDGFEIYCGADITNFYSSFSQIPSKYLVKSNISEVLRDKSITIETQIHDKIVVDLFDRGNHIFTLEKDNDTILKNVNVFISINYLTTSAKATFTRRMGIQPVNYGNVFIYRNGFRVSPYGDKDFDLFGLNIRKTQGHSRYIGTREIIGYIDISDQFGIFKETSSRNNGFIENAHLDVLKDVYMDYAHKLLERYVLLINWGENSDTATEFSFDSVNTSEAEKYKKSLTSKVNGGFSLKFFSDTVSFEDNNPKKKLEQIAASLPEKERSEVSRVIDKFEDLQRERQEQERSLFNQHQTITALKLQNENILKRRSESEFGEQLSHHFPAMADRLKNAVIELQALELDLPASQSNQYYAALRKIRRTEYELRAFKNLLLNTSIDLRSPQVINWFDLANQFIRDKNGAAIKLNCSFSSPDIVPMWDIAANALEVFIMYENFFRNSVEHQATYLQFYFENNTLIISSDSTPILQENLQSIFEPGFSTKANGTGIGLNQIKTFLNRLQLDIHAESSNNIVKFIIQQRGGSNQ
ncbi:Signal transduction histidine kinase [Methylobacillus rhizosphaerae]|uniref:Signal transduction histidine kinase n=1 Tax=Methylobacillus rhizosphaerae TaxID=551994 RepID=A0A239B7U4_9PROT|nr:ATP-binding protein [Methylobacillus rhizosphaerae]SNS03254.1 Signal transduction histidine kinase [Methylobacillus rhizosphaerae]